MDEAEQAVEIMGAFRRMALDLTQAGFRPAIVAEAMLAATQGLYGEKVADRAQVGGWLRTAALAADAAALSVGGGATARRR